MDIDTLRLIMEIQEKDEVDSGRVNQDPNNIPTNSELNLSPDLPIEQMGDTQPILLDQKLDVVVITLLNDQDVEKTILALNSTLKKRKVTGVVYAVSDIINADAFKDAFKKPSDENQEDTNTPESNQEEDNEEQDNGAAIEQNPADETPTLG